MTSKINKRVVLVTTLFLLITTVFSFSASAESGAVFPDDNIYDYNGYRWFPLGTVGNYSASIEQQIAHYGKEAYLRIKVDRIDTAIDTWSYDLCFAGWKCTTYVAKGDELLIPLGELADKLGGFDEANTQNFVLVFGNNVSSGSYRIVVPLDYSHIAKNEPFTSFLTDLPRGLINSFNGFAKHPSGMYKAEFVTALFYVVVLIAIAVGTFVLNLTFSNNNIFRRKK